MALTPGNIQQGPYRVYVGVTPPSDGDALALTDGVPADGTEIGITDGDAEITFSEEISEIKGQQVNGAMDIFIIDDGLTAKFTWKELLNHDQLIDLLMGPSAVVNDAVNSVDLIPMGGVNEPAAAKKQCWVFVTKQRGVSGKYAYLCIYSAYVEGDKSWMLGKENATTMDVNLKGLADPDRSTGGTTAHWGVEVSA